MANPFPQDVAWDLRPSGPFLSFDAGGMQGRIYSDTGHIELAGALIWRVTPSQT